jgi:hypothetical protein
VLPQAGIELPDDDPMQSMHTRQGWNLFECDESRLQGQSKRNAALSGKAKFAISKPVILRELAAEVGATAIHGRHDYRVEHIDVVTRGIAVRVSVRGIELKIAGDLSASLPALNLLLVNPRTKEFLCTRGIGGRQTSHRTSLMGMKQTTIDVEFEPDQRAPARFPANPRDFLNGARLYIVGNLYGGTITRPYEIPEILLEAQR